MWCMTYEMILISDCWVLVIKVWFNPLIYRSRRLPLPATCNCYRRFKIIFNSICYTVWRSYSFSCATLFPGCSIVGMLIGFQCIIEPQEVTGARQKKRNWIYAPVTRYGAVSLTLKEHWMGSPLLTKDKDIPIEQNHIYSHFHMPLCGLVL